MLRSYPPRRQKRRPFDCAQGRDGVFGGCNGKKQIPSLRYGMTNKSAFGEPLLLMLESESDLVGGDCAFAEDHPGVAAAGEIDDGGGGGAGGGAPVDDERELVA
jgi:hypothetical protein